MVGFTHLLSKLYPDEKTTRLYNRIRDPRCNLQRHEAIRIRQEVGIPSNRPGSIADIYKYEDNLKTSIVVISARAGNRKVYPGSDKYESKIFLYHYGEPGHPAEHVPLTDLLPQLHALFETILAETRRNYGDAGVMRIYITHPQLESAIIVPPTYLGDLTSEVIMRKINNVL